MLTQLSTKLEFKLKLKLSLAKATYDIVCHSTKFLMRPTMFVYSDWSFVYKFVCFNQGQNNDNNSPRI